MIPPGSDSFAVFYLPGSSQDHSEVTTRLAALRDTFLSEHDQKNTEWVPALCSHLDTLGDARIMHVRDWLESNCSRFASHADIADLQRKFQDAVVQLKAGLQLCKMQCHQCRLVCVEPRHHPGTHNCNTDHVCSTSCDYCNEHCGLPAGHDSKHM